MTTPKNISTQPIFVNGIIRACSLPKAKEIHLTNSPDSFKAYLSSVYNKTSGFGIDQFDKKVAEITNNINEETVDFAQKLIGQIKKRPNNIGLSENLSSTATILKEFSSNPQKRLSMLRAIDCHPKDCSSLDIVL